MKKHVAVGLVCVAVVFTSSWIAAQDVVGNPKRGEAVYVQHCASCHGVAGDGMGPDARHLVVPPANFQLPKYRAKTDFEMMIAIANGVLFSPMHAWRRKLTEEQIIDVISYIRFLAPFQDVS